MVYASLYPEEGQDINKLRQALSQLKLNDASLIYEPESSPVLGHGFRCGFLGLLHLEIVQERLSREHKLGTIVTTPSVAYRVELRNRERLTITSPLGLPEENFVASVEEPIVIIHLITPTAYLGPLMSYLADLEASLVDNRFLDESRQLLTYRLPLADILTDFYDNIKNISSGYASYNYELSDYQPCQVIKLEILVAEQKVPALTTLVKRQRAEKTGRRIVNTLKDMLPKQQFVLKIQAAVGGKIVAAERLSALRKDVTAKLYGGDVTRKRKLLEKQKKGKKRLLTMGRVEIPTKAYLAVLKK